MNAMKLQALRWGYGKVDKDPAFDHLRGHATFVPGEGPLPARVAIVGEAPGTTENRRRRPFVGPSGKLLNELLEGIGLVRDELFVTNVLKYQPPGDRAPTPAEVRAARGHLESELEIVAPQVVVLLGRTAINTFFPGARVGMVHGRPIVRRRVIFLPAYHPSAALRNSDAHRALTDDFTMISQLADTRSLVSR